MRRLNGVGGQRGSVAVVAALSMLMVACIGAFAIDLGGAYSEQQQLQNGADAAALAIAESCSRGACVDSADRYVRANSLDGRAAGRVVGALGGPVTVEASVMHQNLFAGVVGVPTLQLSARATAGWGWPSGGPTLPLAFSWCAFHQATGGWDDGGRPLSTGEIAIHMIEQDCTPPAHNEVPGGFGWLAGTDCVSVVRAGEWVLSDAGNDGSASCKGFDWSTLRDKTVLVPIFEDSTGTGSNAQYRIKGLAAFTVTGYCFSSSAKWNVTQCPSDRQVKGIFTSYSTLSGHFEISPDAPHFGLTVVKLTA